jgi:hypothetical protein
LTTIKTKEQLLAQTALAASYGMSLPAYLTATATQKSAADQLTATTQAMQLQNDAAGLLTNAITILNGGALSLAQAQTGQAAALNATTAAFTKNGEAIDGGTAAAVANQQALQQKVAADQQAAEATAKATGSTAAGTQAYMDSKAALEQALKAQDDLTPAVQAYIDKLYDVANLKVPPTKLEVDNAQALEAIAQVNASLASVQRAINVSINVQGSGTALATQGGLKVLLPSTGGTVYRASGGGIPNRVVDAMNAFRPVGTDTVPAMLTPGEEVISAGPASKYRNLLKVINAGGDPMGSAGMVSSRNSMTQAVSANPAPMSVSLEGATIMLSVDGQQMTGVIQRQIVKANEQQGMTLGNGVRPLA